MPSRYLVVGNWKMNPASLDDAKRIVRKTRLAAAKLAKTDVVACPPFPFISAAASRKPSANFYLGAQSVSPYESGAHTGDVGAGMLASLGAKYAIVGHSEQRAAGDTDDAVSKRALAALDAGFTAIICVGEKAREESGAHFEFIKNQIRDSLAGIADEKRTRIVLAYEPIWAIGAKEAMAPEQIYEMSLFVKKAFADLFGPEAGLKLKVLYGGSVNALNAADIVTRGKIDGLLVGRESVNLSGFADLLKAVDAIK